MAPKGSAIIFGKIQIVSDAAPLSELRLTLKQILAEEGYPESHGMRSREDPLHKDEETEGEEEDAVLDEEEDAVIEEDESEGEEDSAKQLPWVTHGRTNGVRKK